MLVNNNGFVLKKKGKKRKILRGRLFVCISEVSDVISVCIYFICFSKTNEYAVNWFIVWILWSRVVPLTAKRTQEFQWTVNL